MPSFGSWYRRASRSRWPPPRKPAGSRFGGRVRRRSRRLRRRAPSPSASAAAARRLALIPRCHELCRSRVSRCVSPVAAGSRRIRVDAAANDRTAIDSARNRSMTSAATTSASRSAGSVEDPTLKGERRTTDPGSCERLRVTEVERPRSGGLVSLSNTGVQTTPRPIPNKQVTPTAAVRCSNASPGSTKAAVVGGRVGTAYGTVDVDDRPLDRTRLTMTPPTAGAVRERRRPFQGSNSDRDRRGSARRLHPRTVRAGSDVGGSREGDAPRAEPEGLPERHRSGVERQGADLKIDYPSLVGPDLHRFEEQAPEAVASVTRGDVRVGDDGGRSCLEDTVGFGDACRDEADGAGVDVGYRDVVRRLTAMA